MILILPLPPRGQAPASGYAVEQARYRGVVRSVARRRRCLRLMRLARAILGRGRTRRRPRVRASGRQGRAAAGPAAG